MKTVGRAHLHALLFLTAFTLAGCVTHSGGIKYHAISAEAQSLLAGRIEELRAMLKHHPGLVENFAHEDAAHPLVFRRPISFPIGPPQSDLHVIYYAPPRFRPLLYIQCQYADRDSAPVLELRRKIEAVLGADLLAKLRVEVNFVLRS